jgi:hypothetical protein
MKQAIGTVRSAADGRKLVSRTDAAAAMLLSVIAAAATTARTASAVAGYFSGPVTLTLPLATAQVSPPGLAPGTEAHYASVEATVSTVPGNEAALLAWGDVLNQVAVLAVLALVFLLALRLRRNILFTAGSVWAIGSCGTVLALAGSAGQVLDAIGRTRLADTIGANGDTGNEYAIYVGTFSPAPAVAGLVLILVAGAFQYGRRLQHDAEGLI